MIGICMMIFIWCFLSYLLSFPRWIWLLSAVILYSKQKLYVSICYKWYLCRVMRAPCKRFFVNNWTHTHIYVCLCVCVRVCVCVNFKNYCCYSEFHAVMRSSGGIQWPEDRILRESPCRDNNYWSLRYISSTIYRIGHFLS